MNSKNISANIKGYRKNQGMTQKTLAAKSGLALQTIKQIECQSRDWKVSTLMQIAQVLGVSLADLFREPDIPQCVRFRARKKLQNRSIILSTVGRWLKDYEFLEDLLDRRQQFKLRNLMSERGVGTPEQLAQKVRSKLKLRSDQPIADIGLLLDALGVKLYLYRKTLSDGFDGLSLLDSRQNPAIALNAGRQISAERQIFSAAHELGHILMHLDSFHEDEELKEDSTEEAEASAFAGYFLMPNDGFEKIWEQTSGFWVDRVLYVKSYFRVSYQVVLFRLTERYNQKNLQARFYAAYNTKYGGRLNSRTEPQPLEWCFVENRFQSLVCQALQKDLISFSRAAEMLNISLPEVYQLVKSTPEQE